MTLLPDN